MALRYEIKDSFNPTWRGQRFSTLERAERELTHAVPTGRFVIIDRDPPPCDYCEMRGKGRYGQKTHLRGCINHDDPGSRRVGPWTCIAKDNDQGLWGCDCPECKRLQEDAP